METADKENTERFGTERAAKIQDARRHLLNLTEEQRLAVFYYFCQDCGADDPHCQCWNDE